MSCPNGKNCVFKYHTVSTMAQKRRLKNAKWRESDQQVKSIVDSIMKNVSTAIHIRTTAGQVVLDIVEDAMEVSDAATALRQEKSKAIASLRHDLLIINYRRSFTLPITNLINGHTYTISLRPSNMTQLVNVGYDVEDIIPGTTKHMYAALRAVIPDLRRSVSIRIWYFNNDGEHIVIPSNGIPAVRYVGMKLFMTKLWCGSTPTILEDEPAAGID